MAAKSMIKNMKRLAKVKVKPVVRKPDAIDAKAIRLARLLAKWQKLGIEIKSALAAQHFERAAELSTPKRKLGEEILAGLVKGHLVSERCTGCGEVQNPDGSCACVARPKVETNEQRLARENDYLRGLVTKCGLPCVHCGLTNMGLCKAGFPGCAQADDMMCADDAMTRELLMDKRRLFTLLGDVKPTDARYDGAQLEIHAANIERQLGENCISVRCTTEKDGTVGSSPISMVRAIEFLASFVVPDKHWIIESVAPPKEPTGPLDG